ncbi:Bifunctional purine biosynthetic protein ADE5,7 [Elasticomyces elasticus]|nr:Bifunctional purine biosynthetic protein ADE5,7 [Elasticomyces elasticus]
MTTMKREHNILVLISGNGTNLQALIDACAAGTIPHAKIVKVISNKKDAYGLTRAKDAGIETTYHNLIAGGYTKKYPGDREKAREGYDVDLAKLITTNEPKPDLVVCAGWMHILSPSFVDALQAARLPIINLHPALPGQFDGANAIQRAWTAYKDGQITKTGVMIHYVISEVDRGQPIVTEEISCEECADEDALEAKIHAVEWRIIVQGAVKALSSLP